MKLLLVPALVLCGAYALPTFAQEKQGEKPPAPAPEEKKNEPYKVGSTVDEKLVLTDLDGKTLSFKDLRGKVVMLHFWSMKCPWEPAAEVKFRAMQELYKGKDVVLVAVASNQNEIGAPPAADAKRADLYPEIRKHLKEEKIDYPVYLDHGNKVSDLFQGKSTPHCFVVDQKGVIVYGGALDDDPKADKGDGAKRYVLDAVDATLAGKAVAVAETKPYG